MESDYEQGEIFHHHLDRLEGFVPYGDRINAGEFNSLPIYKPTCVGPIGWRRPIFKPMVEAVVLRLLKAFEGCGSARPPPLTTPHGVSVR